MKQNDVMKWKNLKVFFLKKLLNLLFEDSSSSKNLNSKISEMQTAVIWHQGVKMQALHNLGVSGFLLPLNVVIYLQYTFSNYITSDKQNLILQLLFFILT